MCREPTYKVPGEVKRADYWTLKRDDEGLTGYRNGSPSRYALLSDEGSLSTTLILSVRSVPEWCLIIVVHLPIVFPITPVPVRGAIILRRSFQLRFRKVRPIST